MNPQEQFELICYLRILHGFMSDDLKLLVCDHSDLQNEFLGGSTEFFEPQMKFGFRQMGWRKECFVVITTEFLWGGDYLSLGTHLHGILFSSCVRLEMGDAKGR